MTRSMPPPNGAPLAESLGGSDYRAAFESALPGFIKDRRWFAARSSTINAVTLRQVVALPPADDLALAVADVESDGTRATYQLPLAMRGAAVIDALESPADAEAFAAALLATPPGGPLTVSLFGPAPETHDARVHEGEQSNTSVIFGDRAILKLFRRLSSGRNPDVELTTWLSGPGGFTGVPRTLATVQLDLDGGVADAAIVQQYLENDGDGWSWALELAHSAGIATVGVSVDEWRRSPGGRALVDGAAALGETTARLHLALAKADGVGLEPAPFTGDDWDALTATVRADVDEAIALTGGGLEGLRDWSPAPPASFGWKTRVHGDYHLGQVLDTQDGWVIVDFEGEPSRPLADRAALQHPLVDVASMVRSWHYAAATNAGPKVEGPWVAAATGAFLDAYWRTAGDAPFLPPDDASREAILRVFVLRKALYELGYELGSRPGWAHIPRAALEAIAKDNA